MTKQVTKKRKTEVAVPDEGKGYDNNVSNEDLILPRLDLLQALSPLVIDGEHKAGTFINNITKEEIEAPKIIPIFLTKMWIRWRPRTEGGGMMWRSANPKDSRVIEESKWRGTDKPLATAYLNFLCLVENDDMPIVVSFANTSYQAGRKLYTLTKMTPGNIYDCKYNLTSISRTNNLGTFYVLEVSKAGPSSEDERKKAEDLRKVFANKELNFESEATEKNTSGELSDEF